MKVQVAMDKTKTSFKTTVVWNETNWSKVQRGVFKLQKRIHKAAQRGDVKAMRRLQKTLMKSWYAKLLATRKVTQDNQGKKTAGVDGVKSLGYAERLKLAKELGTKRKVKPTRRTKIPKPGTDEKRPLGIPSMADRANQALAKLALEPEWEAKFENNSYGFRPGRSTHDAIEAIYSAIRCKSKFALDADISKCFDNIDHNKLLDKVNTYPSMRRMLRSWLKAGFVDGRDLFETGAGTPQGGVISPLLANIALHGLEIAIKDFANTLPTRRNHGKKQNRNALSLIRYADDFVILHEDINVVLQAKTVVEKFLEEIGLELKPSETRLCHTFNKYEGEKPGFDFLGFNIRQFPVNDGMSAKAPRSGKILGFQTIIQPSSEAVKRHLKVVSDIVDSHKAAPQKALIRKLIPVIQGWANYYSTVCSKETFTKLDHLIVKKLLAWGRFRHPNKGSKWTVDKYWRTVGGDNWVFSYTNPDPEESYMLAKHAWTKIVRHTKVKGEVSPFNGDFVYWGSRTGKSKEIPSTLAKTLRQQKGKCVSCGQTFTTEDRIELDHITPISKGGKRKLSNLQALHRHCHDKKTATDGSLGGSHDKGMFSEEPDEVKASRPVLETSSIRENVAQFNGTGAVLEPRYINQLPAIRNCLSVSLVGEIGKTTPENRRELTEAIVDGNKVCIYVGDSRQGWVKSYQCILELSSDDRLSDGEVEVAIDLSDVRPAGEILKGFGGVANPVKLPQLYQRCAGILNKAVGRKLNSIECCLLIDEAATTIVAGNIRRSAGMRQGISDDAVFSGAKSNLWQQDENGNWRIDPDRDALRMANHTRVFHHKPTEAECIEAVQQQYYSGEGAIQYAPEAIARGNADIFHTPELKQEFIEIYTSLGAEETRNWLKTNYPEMPEHELEHRLQRYGLNPCGEQFASR